MKNSIIQIKRREISIWGWILETPDTQSNQELSNHWDKEENFDFYIGIAFEGALAMLAFNVNESTQPYVCSTRLSGMKEKTHTYTGQIWVKVLTL